MVDMIVFFNGPPYSGKDTGGLALNWPIFKLAKYIKVASHILYANDANVITPEDQMQLVEEKGLKDKPVPCPKNKHKVDQCVSYLLPSSQIAYDVLGVPIESFQTTRGKLASTLLTSDPLSPVTWRKVYIWMSEKVLKPLFGQGIMGQLLIADIKKTQPKRLCITDCGFEEEVKQILAAFPEATKVLIRCHREGKDFSNDSRSYLPLNMFDLSFDLHNKGTIQEWQHQIKNVLKS